MLPARFTILSVLAAALLAGQAYAAGAADVELPKEVGKVLRKHRRYSEEEIKNERARLAAVGERVNRVFTLLGGETALQKGQAGTALATYMLMLERTKSPEVAERALEMAVSLNAFEQAEMIYQKWRQIEPIPGEAQKRAGWLRNVLREGGNQHLDGLEEVLAQSDDVQKRRIFLLLVQAAVQQGGVAQKASKAVRRAALKYEHLPEAAVADAVFGVQGREKEKAIEALQRLAKLDTEILPPTLMTLRLTARKYPEILDGFFEQTDTQNLSAVWQEMEIMNLVSLRKPDDAYARLNVLLEHNPNANLYIQAAILAANRKEGVSVIDGYAEKAYGRGDGGTAGQGGNDGGDDICRPQGLRQSQAVVEKSVRAGIPVRQRRAGGCGGCRIGRRPGGFAADRQGTETSRTAGAVFYGRQFVQNTDARPVEAARQTGSPDRAEQHHRQTFGGGKHGTFGGSIGTAFHYLRTVRQTGKNDCRP